MEGSSRSRLEGEDDGKLSEGVEGVTVTIELERVIRIIERTEDEEILREIYEWLKENDLMKQVPRELWWKLMVAGGEAEEMTPEEEKAIKEALEDDELIPQEEIEKELGL